ncbi:hypothetical protein [Thiorhodospira sibirica]|uniref:hypothetical protein n=1 Tax=Thiorhodospira sibirica TaxID=154347 RepID=UPI00022C22F5|nr:hypothetical protein [Thiorhodospira sibirica]
MYAVEFETDVTSRFIELKDFEQLMHQHVKVIVLANNEPIKPPQKAPYDFSDLVGKLAWEGDALSQQSALRDEW